MQRVAEPALALSIPEKPNDVDDGLLTASEIAQLKVDADWAVLSACNTAAEDNPGAEALSGLARAFFYAGARSLIVSHWSVSDEATARLMIGTFRASERNPQLSHAEALRESMLAMRNRMLRLIPGCGLLSWWSESQRSLIEKQGCWYLLKDRKTGVEIWVRGVRLAGRRRICSPYGMTPSVRGLKRSRPIHER